MNRRLLATIGLIVLGVLVFLGGAVFAQSGWMTSGRQPGWMMGQVNSMQPGPGLTNSWNEGQGYSSMLGGSMMGGSMMAGNMMSGSMMAGNMMSGGMMSGMMGPVGGLTGVDPLSIEAATAAVNNYLATLNNDNLTLGEVMIFDNQAYAQILAKDTGQGAFEVLVDPASGNVFPEPGPNMMWNTEYGMMAGAGGLGMMGGAMMGGYDVTTDGEINVSADDAVSIAQAYLDANLPGKTADEHADAFPGYYTLHVLEDGAVVGMLSVQATSGQVFLHQWHGRFIEMAEPVRQ